MEHIYTIETKMLQGKLYYFVKKLMKLSEFKGLADITIGYGMHTSFEKACSIANIHDASARQSLLLKLEAFNKPQLVVKPHKVEIAEMVNQWLELRGSEVLN